MTILSKLKKINYFLFNFIFNFFSKRKLFLKIFIFLASYSSTIFSILYFLFIIYIIFNFKNNFTINNVIYLFEYLLAPTLTLFINLKLRNLFKVKRPEQTFKIKPFIYHNKNYSLPSNHSAMAMVISICVGSVFTNFKYLLLVISFLTGFSRVAVGVHYPFDVLVGFFVAYFVTYVLQI